MLSSTECHKKCTRKGVKRVLYRLTICNPVSAVPCPLPQWFLQPKQLKSGSVYSVEAKILACSPFLESREALEYKCAVDIFLDGVKYEQSNIDDLYYVSQVDIYVNNNTASAAYESTKAELRRAGYQPNEEWVFHGTKDSSVENIMTNGFYIGGLEVPLFHGQVHGAGVYASKCPSISLDYASPQTDKLSTIKLIIAKGIVTSDDKNGSHSGATKNAPYLLFPSGRYLLPTYVIHLR